MLLFLATVLLWLPVGFRLRALRRRPGDRAQQAAFLASFTFALAATVLLPPAYLVVGQLIGVPNLARYLGDTLVVVSCWCSLVFLVYLTEPEDAARLWARRCARVLLAPLLVMSGLFALAHTRPEAWRPDPADVHGPFLLVFRLVFFATLALVAWHGIRLLWRYGRMARQPALHLGTLLMALGNVFGLTYVTQQALYVSSRLAAVPYPLGDPAGIGSALVAGFMLCMVVGATLPAWGQHVGVPALYRWLGQYRAHRRLYPLWRALALANQEIALLPPQPPLLDALTIRRLGFHLYRRVIEIWDGRLALQPYADEAVASNARALCERAGLPDDQADAVIEATSLAAALRAKASGRLPARATSPVLPAARQSADFEGDAVFLGEVAHHFVRSPIVRTVLRHVEHGAPTLLVDQLEARTGRPDPSPLRGHTGDATQP